MYKAEFKDKTLLEKKIKLKICLTVTTTTSGYCDFKAERLTSSNKSQFTDESMLLFKTLEQCGIDEEIFQNCLEVSKISMPGKGGFVDRAYTKEEIGEFSKFNIVHILPGPTQEETIYSSLHLLKNRSIVLSPCVATKRPPAPADFPGHMVISVGSDQTTKEETNGDGKGGQSSTEEKKPLVKPEYKWQSYGSALDFKCQGFSDVQINNPFDASYYATAIAALVILRAHSLGKLFQN